MKTKPAIYQHLNEFLQRHKQDWWIILAMILVTILISVPVYALSIYTTNYNDYVAHIRFAESILNQQYQDVPVQILAHLTYQILLVGIYELTFHTVGLYAIAALVQVVVQILIVLFIYFWLGEVEKKQNWFRAVLAATLAIVAPVMAFAFLDKLYYLGYVGLANYHNPTVHLLKPVALLSFIFALRIFTPLQNSWKIVFFSAFLTVLAALIKPNYLICIFPALGFMALLYLVRREPIDWRLLILGIFLPGTLILLAQFAVAYYFPGSEGGGIFFSPLGVMSEYSKYLLPKLILSILFPLAVLVLNFRQAIHNNTLILAWLGFLASLVPTYFLAEGGVRFTQGNFLWGSQIMLFLLFVASAYFLWREKLISGIWIKRKNMIALIAYAFHVCAGIAYYVYAATQRGQYPF